MHSRLIGKGEVERGGGRRGVCWSQEVKITELGSYTAAMDLMAST